MRAWIVLIAIARADNSVPGAPEAGAGVMVARADECVRIMEEARAALPGLRMRKTRMWIHEEQTEITLGDENLGPGVVVGYPGFSDGEPGGWEEKPLPTRRTPHGIAFLHYYDPRDAPMPAPIRRVLQRAADRCIDLPATPATSWRARCFAVLAEMRDRLTRETGGPALVVTADRDSLGLDWFSREREANQRWRVELRPTAGLTSPWKENRNREVAARRWPCQEGFDCMTPAWAAGVARGGIAGRVEASVLADVAKAKKLLMPAVDRCLDLPR
jgi:hypothetical protein